MQHDNAFSLRERQLAAISRMLNLDRDADDSCLAWHDPWKVLVYDAFCRDVISPLLKVADLRKRGVTLHLLIDSDREQIADVPAVYFVRPTAANARRIASDCALALYESFHLNFTPSIPRPLLESLASQTLEAECVAHVSRVVDQYLSFASLEDDLFSLQLPRAYPALTSPASKDAELQAAVDEVVSGLFSVLVTLGVVPVLRYSRRGPAQAVAEGLGKRLHAQLRSQATLFSGAAAAALQRPLLVLVDRTDDLGAMLQHGWSYCALCHDLLGMRCRRVNPRTSYNPTTTPSLSFTFSFGVVSGSIGSQSTRRSTEEVLFIVVRLTRKLSATYTAGLRDRRAGRRPEDASKGKPAG